MAGIRWASARHLLLADLRHRWIEYALATIFIALVIAVLVVQRSVTASADERVHELAHRLGKNMLVVPAASRPSDFHLLRYESAGIPDGYPERLARSPLAQHVHVVEAQLRGQVDVGGIPLLLVGERAGTRNGRANGADPVELGAEAAERLQVRSGDELVIAGRRAVVGGVRQDVSSDGLGMAVYTRLDIAQELLNRPGQINSMRLAGCWCRLDVPALGREIETLLPGTRAITVAGVLKAQQGAVATMRRYAPVLYVTGALFVGAIIAALVASQVRRSMREIGLLLAIGAPSAFIQTLLLVKADLVGISGGLLGYLAGSALTTRFGSDLLGLPLSTPSGLWLPALVLCGLVSLVAALVPARRAARLDPTQVLREE